MHGGRKAVVPLDLASHNPIGEVTG